jgi:hypothetical protein
MLLQNDGRTLVVVDRLERVAEQMERLATEMETRLRLRAAMQKGDDDDSTR